MEIITSKEALLRAEDCALGATATPDGPRSWRSKEP